MIRLIKSFETQNKRNYINSEVHFRRRYLNLRLPFLHVQNLNFLHRFSPPPLLQKGRAAAGAAAEGDGRGGRGGEGGQSQGA